MVCGSSVNRARSGLLPRVYAEIDAIVHAPYQSSTRQADVRRRNIPVYPYGIYYRVADDLITILTVRHHSREPIDWDRHPE